MRTLEDICLVKPKRIVMDSSGLFFQKPCGALYKKNDEVHCEAYKNKTCEYLKEV